MRLLRIYDSVVIGRTVDPSYYSVANACSFLLNLSGLNVWHVTLSIRVSVTPNALQTSIVEPPTLGETLHSLIDWVCKITLVLRVTILEYPFYKLYSVRTLHTCECIHLETIAEIDWLSILALFISRIVKRKWTTSNCLYFLTIDLHLITFWDQGNPNSEFNFYQYCYMGNGPHSYPCLLY